MIYVSLFLQYLLCGYLLSQVVLGKSKEERFSDWLLKSTLFALLWPAVALTIVLSAVWFFLVLQYERITFMRYGKKVLKETLRKISERGDKCE